MIRAIHQPTPAIAAETKYSLKSASQPQIGSNDSGKDIATISDAASHRTVSQQTSEITSEEAGITLADIKQNLTGDVSSSLHAGLDPDRVMRLIGLIG